MADGLCREVGPELFYPDQGGSAIYADPKLICSRCPVQSACLKYALDNMNDDIENGTYGVGMWGCWGGTTPDERFEMLNRRQRVAA